MILQAPGGISGLRWFYRRRFTAGDRDFHGILQGTESSHEMLMGWDFRKKTWRTWDGMKIISMFSWSNPKKVSITTYPTYSLRRCLEL